MKHSTKSLLALGAGAALFLQSASAQTSLFTTANDFGQFNSGAGTVSSLYYSDSSTVNGIGNTSSPGGADAVGSLTLTAPGGWSGWVSGSDFPGASQAFLSAIDPGAIAPWSAGSGYGPGTLVACSGTMSFDLYGGNLTDWNWWGVSFNYNNNWYQAWASTSSNFTGADGQTWTHYVIPYTINDVNAGLSYFGIGLAENAGSIASQTFYVDNFQVVVSVPEPGIFALLGLGSLGVLLFRRRAGR